MDFIAAIKTCFTQYAKFSGRAGRSEFWYWALFSCIVNVVLNALDLMFFGANAGTLIFTFSNVFSLTIAVPGMAVGARRLHDVGRSGWWQLLMLTVIGIPVVIYWWACKGKEDSAY